MRVHIICRDTHKTRILPRLANQLATTARWTLGNVPDSKADINYFFPYLEWCDVGRGFKDTLTAAWFTHRDTYAPGNKATLWDEAAQVVDLCLTSAKPNLDILPPGTRLVTPLIDTDLFKPARCVRADMLIIGTAGYVYPGGRKGEQLIKQLAADNRFHVVATGKGWPVTCRELDWLNLPSFYQSLDVYVVTSLLEGLPAGPLEALACGVPVVVPHGVGLLDDLPDIPGIMRYKSGDYDSLVEGINAVLIDGHQVHELRASIASIYTLAAWRNDHERAFEDLLWPPRDAESLPDWNGRSGVYCVAFGKPSRKMAAKLVPSIKANMPDVPVCFVSDKPLDKGEIFVAQSDADIGGRIAKIRMYELAPLDWDYVLYLDADTEVVADVSVLFQFLADGWELVICKNPGKYHVLSMMGRPDNKEETDITFKELGSHDLLQLNGGVMAFRRCDRVRRFFELWQMEWERWGKRDQAALHRALWQQPLRVLVLGNEFNTITRYDDSSITAGILHYPTTARRWKGRIEGRLDSEEAWAAVITA